MLTAKRVQKISLSGQPADLGGFHLTVEDLMKLTRPEDWYGCYLELDEVAASRIAGLVNVNRDNLVELFAAERAAIGMS